MNNNLVTPTTQSSNSFDVTNPLVAAIAILTVGVCYCVTITVNAKYNRDTELTYKDFSLKSHSAAPVAVVAD